MDTWTTLSSAVSSGIESSIFSVDARLQKYSKVYVHNKNIKYLRFHELAKKEKKNDNDRNLQL